MSGGKSRFSWSFVAISSSDNPPASIGDDASDIISADDDMTSKIKVIVNRVQE